MGIEEELLNSWDKDAPDLTEEIIKNALKKGVNVIIVGARGTGRSCMIERLKEKGVNVLEVDSIEEAKPEVPLSTIKDIEPFVIKTVDRVVFDNTEHRGKHRKHKNKYR